MSDRIRAAPPDRKALARLIHNACWESTEDYMSTLRVTDFTAILDGSFNFLAIADHLTEALAAHQAAAKGKSDD